MFQVMCDNILRGLLKIIWGIFSKHKVQVFELNCIYEHSVKSAHCKCHKMID